MKNAKLNHPVLITFLDWDSVKTRTHLSRSEIYRRVNSKTFPPPAKLGPRKNVWQDFAIEKWLVENLKKGGY